jgi:hypothetical protein
MFPKVVPRPWHSAQGMGRVRLQPQIDNAAVGCRVAGERSVKVGSTFRPDLGLQRIPDLAVGSRPEFQGQEDLRPLPQPSRI